MLAAANADPVKFFSSRHAVIGRVHAVDEGRRVVGKIFSFLNFSEQADWLDIKRRSGLAGADVADRVELLRGIRPEMQEHDFVFDVQRHEVLVGSTLSPRHIEKILVGILNQEVVLAAAEDVPLVEVSLHQSKEFLEQVKAYAEIREFTVTIQRPNPDELDDYQREVERQMRDDGSFRRTTTHATGRYGTGLSLSPATIREAELALRMGSVSGRARKEDDGKVEGFSTQHHAEPYVVEQDVGKGESRSAALLRWIRNAFSRR